MDLSLTKSCEDTETDTPPHPIISFATATVPFHHHHHFRHHPQPQYKECMKNHAAHIGGHAVDGCGEFMQQPDPTSLKCVACGCHRNFHRQDTAPPAPFLDFRHPAKRKYSVSLSPSPPPPSQHRLLALSAAAEDHHPMTPIGENRQPAGRKRFRSKFSREQKEKMQRFSEKMGWRMQKSEEGEVEEFCREIGVAKGVLKVWMHNNKNTVGKKGRSVNEGMMEFDDEHNNNGGHRHGGSNNGSSSTST